MGRDRGSEGLSTLPKMAQLENSRTQNQLLIGLAQKSGLFLQDSGQDEDTQLNGKTNPTGHYVSDSGIARRPRPHPQSKSGPFCSNCSARDTSASISITCFSIPPKRTGMWVRLACDWLIHRTWAGCDRVTWKLASRIGSQQELWPRLKADLFP